MLSYQLYTLLHFEISWERHCAFKVNIATGACIRNSSILYATHLETDNFLKLKYYFNAIINCYKYPNLYNSAWLSWSSFYWTMTVRNFKILSLCQSVSVCLFWRHVTVPTVWNGCCDVYPPFLKLHLNMAASKEVAE